MPTQFKQPNTQLKQWKHRAQFKRRLEKLRARRGFSLIELVVAIALVAMMSAGVAVAVIKISNNQKIELTRTNAQSLRSAVKVWWAMSNDSACPTVSMLIADGAIDKSKSTAGDAWGEPWRIKCEQNDATVVSKGPDKQPDTDDDIRVPTS